MKQRAAPHPCPASQLCYRAAKDRKPMPYFTRQPYAATVLQHAEPVEEMDFLALASGVLAQETSLPAQTPFRIRTPLRPGARGSLVLEFTAEDAPVAIRLAATDLTGPNGVIPSDSLKIHPSFLALSPGEAADVSVSVAVPASAIPGTYRGRVTSAGADGFTAPIEVVVVS
jgi:hypothetical protein